MNTQTSKLIVFSILASACGVDSVVVTGGNAVDTTSSARQKEAWSGQDAPTLFTNTLEYRLEALPMNGEAATIPWAGSYWPTYEDNINYKWAGPSSTSASKKYGLAFYDGGTDVEALVSRYHGIESVAKTCQQDSECKAEFAETCVRRDGADAGRCVASWWGICHAWAPAAILMPEPRFPVTRNGVTFEPQDLKALGSLVHNSTQSKFVSLRCNKTDGAADAGGIAYDEHGRPSNANRECRDTNAGTYHLLIANYLGVMKQSFVEDRTNNYQVWNQPLRSFTVTSKAEVTAAQANQLIGVTSGESTYKFNTAAARFFHVKMQVKYISESSASDGYTAPQIDWYTHNDFYEYVLELDAAGKIIGGEWVGSSKRSHPDFLWLPTGAGTSSVAGGSIKYSVVKEMVLESAGLTADAGSGGGNPGSAQDVTLTATVGRGEWKNFGPYPTAAGPITVEMSGNGDADLYVRLGGQPSEALYDCRPYTGTSSESCTLTGPGPLFIAVHGYAASQVTVRVRYTAAGTTPAVDAGTPRPDAGQPVDAGSGPTPIPNEATYSATVAANAWVHFGPWNAGAGTVQVDMTGSGDGDLYVRKGAAPTDAAYDCRPYASGSAESCAVTGPGVIYVSVKGYSAATVSLKVRFTPQTGPTATHLDTSGTVAQDELKLFQVPVTAGKKIVVRTTAASDVDLYLKLGAAPTVNVYDARGYTDSGNETVSFTPSASGTLFIAVHGYSASSFTLKTADQ